MFLVFVGYFEKKSEFGRVEEAQKPILKDFTVESPGRR
jgi:hypothetical protein